MPDSSEPLRVLIVDDSAYNRRSIAETIAHSPEVKVVGKAADGEEALRLVSVLKPDVITLDLEMPRMDGFTFLRILMSKMPTPVIVVSSYSQKENVFKALVQPFFQGWRLHRARADDIAAYVFPDVIGGDALGQADDRRLGDSVSEPVGRADNGTRHR